LKTTEQLQFEGYLQTPQLWGNTPILDLKQIDLPTVTDISLNELNLPKRLGHRVEQFVFQELNTIADCDIITTNLQIIENKITLGELDCLLKYQNKTVHLEIVYKFYLYDETVGTTEIEHWIGPNRKDSLLEKLTKLKEKQLPLLHHKSTQTVLQKLNVDSTKMVQQVYFKAQLFVPIQHLKKSVFVNKLPRGKAIEVLSFNSLAFNVEHLKINPLGYRPAINNDCIMGFYIPFSEVSNLKENTFYIPPKLEWLVVPNDDVQWISFEKFIQNIVSFIEKKQSPMCWLKDSNGHFQKFFVTWW